MSAHQLRNAIAWLAASISRRLQHEQAGASLVEYALLLALIAVVAIGAILIIGQVTSNSINNVANNFPK